MGEDAASQVNGLADIPRQVTLPVFAEGEYDVENLNQVPAHEHFMLTGSILKEINGLVDGATAKSNAAP